MALPRAALTEYLLDLLSRSDGCWQRDEVGHAGVHRSAPMRPVIRHHVDTPHSVQTEGGLRAHVCFIVRREPPARAAERDQRSRRHPSRRSLPWRSPISLFTPPATACSRPCRPTPSRHSGRGSNLLTSPSAEFCTSRPSRLPPSISWRPAGFPCWPTWRMATPPRWG